MNRAPTFFQLFPKIRVQAYGLFLRADQAAYRQNHISNFLKGSLIGNKYRETFGDKLARDVFLKVGKSENKIGPQFAEFIQPDGSKGRDFGFGAGFGRADRKARDADDAVSGAERENEFRGFGRDTGNPAGPARLFFYIRLRRKCRPLLP